MSDEYKNLFKQMRDTPASPTKAGVRTEFKSGNSVRSSLLEDSMRSHFAMMDRPTRRSGDRSANGSVNRPPKNSVHRHGARKAAASPEEQLKRALKERHKRKLGEVRAKQKTPWASFAFVVSLFFFAGIGYAFPKSLDFVASHVDLGIFSSASAADAAAGKEGAAGASSKEAAGSGTASASPAAGDPKSGEKLASAEGANKEKSSASGSASKADAPPNIHNWTPEELSFFNKLSERKAELDQREVELNKLDEELQKQKAELDKKIKQLEKIRSEISSTLKTRVSNDQEKVDKLVQVYSGMKPQQAAKVIETLNEDLAVEVLDKMKKKSAAEILDTMDAKKAQRLSEMLTGYRKPAESKE